MSVECQVNIKSQSELDIGGRETCYYLNDFEQNFEVLDVKHKALINNLLSNVFTHVVWAWSRQHQQNAQNCSHSSRLLYFHLLVHLIS